MNAPHNPAGQPGISVKAMPRTDGDDRRMVALVYVLFAIGGCLAGLPIGWLLAYLKR